MRFTNINLLQGLLRELQQLRYFRLLQDCSHTIESNEKNDAKSQKYAIGKNKKEGRLC